MGYQFEKCAYEAQGYKGVFSGEQRKKQKSGRERGSI